MHQLQLDEVVVDEEIFDIQQYDDNMTWNKQMDSHQLFQTDQLTAIKRMLFFFYQLGQ